MTWLYPTVALALWALVIARARASSTSTAQRLMSATVVFLAANVTLRVPVVWEAVGDVAGGAFAIGCKHLLTMTTETLILLFVREVHGRGISRRAIVATALAAGAAITALLFVVEPTDAALTYEGYARLYTSSWSWMAYWSITVAFGLWAFTAGARFYWRYQHQAGRGADGLGFLLIGLGTSIAALITALKACVVLSALLGRMSLWDGWAIKVAPLMIAALVLAVVAGLVSKSTAARWARWRARGEHLRSLSVLEPLWQTLTRAVPNITLDHRAMASLTGRHLSAHDKLYRRVIEINDGLLVLAPYTSAPLWQEALERAHASGEPAQQARVIADTVALHASLTNYRAHLQAASSTAHLVTRQSGDFSAEVDRLSLLARASRCCPLTAHITQQMLERERP